MQIETRQLADDDVGNEGRDKDCQKREQENFITKNIRTASKIDKIQKVRMLCRGILKDQEIQQA